MSNAWSSGRCCGRERTCASSPNSWRLPPARCSRRTPCSPSWATGSPCRTTSPGGGARVVVAVGRRPDRGRGPARRTRAYNLYLRANELARTYGGLSQARELYARCLDLDSRFAPAWAHLGRCHRVVGKFVQGTPDSESLARQALDRALELNPRLPVAHKFYASLEGDVGEARQGLLRLTRQANRHGNDAELFAGLVSACRYGGLNEASVAAHVEARRLDPNVPTSLGHTLLLAGDVERLLALERPRPARAATSGFTAGPPGWASPAVARRHVRAWRRCARGLASPPSRRPPISSLPGSTGGPRRCSTSSPRRARWAARGPRVSVPRGLAALRRRRPRTRAYLPARALSEGLLCGPDALDESVVRPPPERSAVSSDPG